MSEPVRWSSGAWLLAWLLAGCARPPSVQPERFEPVPSASAATPEAPSAGAMRAQAPEPPPSAAEAPSAAAAQGPWQGRCAAAIEAALERASAKEPRLRGARVGRETRVADGVRREGVVVSGFPPVFPGGFMAHVERSRPSPEASQPPGSWGRRVESLHGGYHAMFLRKGLGIDAGLSFDGFRQEQVWELAPLFQAGIDRCFEQAD